MRFISTRTHGVLYYVAGALLIVVPYATALGFTSLLNHSHAPNCAFVHCVDDLVAARAASSHHEREADGDAGAALRRSLLDVAAELPG